MKKRIANASVLLVVGTVVVGLGWLVSMGLYALGLWPLGALLRAGLLIPGLWFLYWIGRHLVEGEEAMTDKEIERVLGRPKDKW